MRFRFIPSIRSRLALLVAAFLFPATLLALSVLFYNYHLARTKLENESIAKARTITALVDKDFASIEAMLRSLASSPSLTSRDLPAFYQQAQSVLGTQAVNNIVLSAPDGTQLLNTLRPLGSPLSQRATPSRLHLLAETNGPVISDLFIGRVAQRPVIVVSIPVRRNGKHAYNLGAGIFPEQFEKLLREQHLPSDWITAVIDTSGTIVARTHEMKRFIGRPAAERLTEAMQYGSKGAFEGKTSEGIPVLGVFSRSAATGWTVAIGIPAKNMTAKLKREIGRLVFAIAMLFAMSIAIAWYLGGQIAQSIRALISPALALGEGKEFHLPVLHLREAQEGGDALLKASQALEQAQHQANHDTLTGLVNRKMFHEILDQQVVLCHRNATHLSLLYIDLDGFKAVNDTHGHAAGDLLLSQVAERLSAHIRASDIAARIGGDEFAIALIGTPAAMAVPIAREIVKLLSRPYDLNGEQGNISASIGIASYPECGQTGQKMMDVADEAMYHAKMKGKQQVAEGYRSDGSRLAS